MVGAGLPHLPVLLSASKSYSERLFRYPRIDRLDREAADLALSAPAEREASTSTSDALDALYEAADGYPYFVQAYGKVTWDIAPATPITAGDVEVAAPEAEANWPSASSAHATSGRPPPSATTCAPWPLPGDEPRADRRGRHELGRKPSSLSPARDGLIKKGLVYAPNAGSSPSPSRTSAGSCAPSPPSHYKDLELSSTFARKL